MFKIKVYIVIAKKQVSGHTVCTRKKKADPGVLFVIYKRTYVIKNIVL